MILWSVFRLKKMSYVFDGNKTWPKLTNSVCGEGAFYIIRMKSPVHQMQIKMHYKHTCVGNLDMKYNLSPINPVLSSSSKKLMGNWDWVPSSSAKVKKWRAHTQKICIFNIKALTMNMMTGRTMTGITILCAVVVIVEDNGRNTNNL